MVPLTDPAGCLEGPFNAMLLSPGLGSALQLLGAAIRFRGELTGREREIAILAVAGQWQSAFERYAHEVVAEAVGLTDDTLRGLWSGDASPILDRRERLVAEVAVALCETADLTDDEYAAAIDELGEAVLFELLTLVGFYETIALQLRVFRVGVPC